jgi:hypothetical protein
MESAIDCRVESLFNDFRPFRRAADGSSMRDALPYNVVRASLAASPSMSNTIDQYREAKNSYLKLRNQAKRELILRFNEVANELLQLQRELLEDFGEKVALPTKGKKPRHPRAPKAAPAPAAAPESPKALELRKQLERQKKKLTDAQAAGKATKAIEDRMYEIDDELRLLANQKG